MPIVNSDTWVCYCRRCDGNAENTASRDRLYHQCEHGSWASPCRNMGYRPFGIGEFCCASHMPSQWRRFCAANARELDQMQRCTACGERTSNAAGWPVVRISSTPDPTNATDARLCGLCASRYTICTLGECNGNVSHHTSEDPHDTLGVADMVAGLHAAECEICRDADLMREFVPIVVNGYGYKPNPIFTTAKSEEKARTKLFLGMENEITFPMRNQTAYNNGARALLSATDGLIYLKSDGSIPYGWEAVSHPLSYAYWETEFPHEVWDKVAEAGGREDEHCGIHVHVSRAGFADPRHIYRWMHLWGNPDLIPYFQAIAGRGSNTYCNWEPSGTLSYARQKSQGNEYGDRYNVLNFQNSATIEVRAFRNSVTASDIMARLGLVAASVAYATTLPDDVSNSAYGSWDAFKSWLEGQNAYEALQAKAVNLRPAHYDGTFSPYLSDDNDHFDEDDSPSYDDDSAPYCGCYDCRRSRGETY